METRDPAGGRATDDERAAAPRSEEESDRSGEPIGEHRRSGRLLLSRDVGKKMHADPTMTEDRKLLEPSARPAFLDTDPWRALRILAEFVDGFDALAEIGKAVTVFGSARVAEGDPAYKSAREIGRLLAAQKPQPDSFETLLSVTSFGQTDVAAEILDVHALPNTTGAQVTSSGR